MSRTPIVLILGDTPEARALAEVLHARGIDGLYAHAGRRAPAEPLPLPTRIGGFGGPDGLVRYLGEAGITHIIDATHPFTRRMSQNAVLAATRTGLPLLAFTRPAWTAGANDTWISAPDMARAVAALDTDPQRIFLAVPRQDVARFAKRPQHHYLLRLPAPARSAPPLADHDIVIDRGPFDMASERTLLESRKIGLVVTRNTGAPAAQAKLEAARALRLPVLMIERPELPERPEVHRLEDVMAWLDSAEPRAQRH